MKIASMFNDVFLSLWKRPFTERYPFKTRPAPTRLRGKLLWDQGKCKGCMLCVRDCPARAIEIDVADRAARKYKEEDLKGLPCYAGLDLSTNTDLTAFVLAFPKDDGVYLWPYIFMPADNIEEASKRDNVPYGRWVQDGHIIATPGNVVDYNRVMERLEFAKSYFDLQSVSFDPWRATQTATQAEEKNIKMIPVAASFAGMSAPCVEFERLLLSGRLFHPGNPCMDWAANNIEVRTSVGGIIAPNKPAEKAGARKRIDPIVAAILSLERIARGAKPEVSIYEKRGVLWI